MQDWHSFTSAQTAAVNPQLDYATTKTYLMPLTQQRIIAINGPDAAKFLQGQVTCDVRELANNQALLGAQCNIKGRMLLTFLALQTTDEQILLRIHGGLATQAISNLGKYIVFSKAKLADLEQEYHCVGVIGAQAPELVQQLFSTDIEQDNQWQLCEKGIVVRISAQKYELWLNSHNAQTTWLTLAEHCELTSNNLWTLTDIEAGIGGISPETYEEFTPQAINWQLVKGINFRKGCYTGQEVVARLHYRGTLKRHMYRFGFIPLDNQLPTANSELHNSEGKVVGEVILAAFKGKKGGELLASVTDSEREAIYLAGNPQKLELLSLPYAIPTAEEAN